MRRLWVVAASVAILALAPVPAQAEQSLYAQLPTPQHNHNHNPHSAKAKAAIRRAPHRRTARPTSKTVRTGQSTILVLAFGSGYDQPGGSPLVRSLQRRLAAVGFPPGPIDGLYGPLTELAVVRFQAAHRLSVDGVAGPRTLAALASAGPVLYPGTTERARVRALQRRLSALGYPPGPIDGRFGPLTEHAVSRFQAAHGLAVDGIAGPKTLARLAGPRRPGEVRRQPQRTQPRHRGGEQRPRPVPSLPTAKRPSLTTSSVPSTTRRSRRSGGSLSIVWLALFVGVGLALLTVACWRAHRRGTVRAIRHAAAGRDTAAYAASSAEQGSGDVADRHDDADRVYALGALLEQRGELAAARAAYERVNERIDRRADADRVYALGVLLEQRGELAAARAAYERADRRGHGPAACNLGVLLEEQGELVAAHDAFTRADHRGDANGTFNLGVLLEQRGELAVARAAYERADRRGHGPAACNLGVLLEEQGELVAAHDAFARADHRGDANGAFNLGVLLEQDGDLVGALAAFERAGERGSDEIRERAQAALLGLDRGGAANGDHHNGGRRNGGGRNGR